MHIKHIGFFLTFLEANYAMENLSTCLGFFWCVFTFILTNIKCIILLFLTSNKQFMCSNLFHSCGRICLCRTLWITMLITNGFLNMEIQGSPEDITFTSHLYNSNNEQSIDMECRSSSYPKSLSILRRGAKHPIKTRGYNSKNYQELLFVTVNITPVKCSSMGIYECVVVDYKNVTKMVTTVVAVEKCPIKPCYDELNDTTVYYAYSNSNVTVSICVIAYPEIADKIAINGEVYTISGTPWMEYNVSRSGMLHYVNFTLINLKLTDFINYTVTLYSLLNQPLSLIVEIQNIELSTTSKIPLNEISTSEDMTIILRGVTEPGNASGNNRAQSGPLTLTLVAIPIGIFIVAAASLIFLKAKMCKAKKANPRDHVYDSLNFGNEEIV